MRTKRKSEPAPENGPEWDQFKRAVLAIAKQPHVDRPKGKPSPKRRPSVVVKEGQQ